MFKSRRLTRTPIAVIAITFIMGCAIGIAVMIIIGRTFADVMGSPSTAGALVKRRITPKYYPGIEEKHSAMSEVGSWSPDGSQLLLLVHVAQQFGSWFVVGLDGSNPREILPDGWNSGNIYSMVWSPVGDAVLMTRGHFVGDEAGVPDGLYLADLNLEHVELLFKVEDSELGFGEPTWSPDEQRIAFSQTIYDEGHWGSIIIVMNRDGTGQHTIFNSPQERCSHLSWSLNGDLIAMEIETCPNRSDIFVIHPDGSGLKNLTDTCEYSELSPSWSPDGEQIAYSMRLSHYPGGEKLDGWTPGVYVMDRNGNGKRLLSEGEGNYGNLRWSPDGKWIAADEYGWGEDKLEWSRDVHGSTTYLLPAQP